MTALDFDWRRTTTGWDEWDPLLERWLGEATELMLDQAGVASGSRVLDVAAGAGGQTLAAASRTGTDGLVLGTDIDVEPGAFDAAICRLGLMFLPDVHEALLGIRTALRPGGRLSAIVFAERNPSLFPGRLGLGRSGVLEAAFGAAGFIDVEVERVDAPMQLLVAGGRRS